MRKLTAERNKVLNKRKVYLRSKNENIKLEEKISNSKKVWLNKQLRKKGVDGPAILKEVAEMVETLVEIQVRCSFFVQLLLEQSTVARKNLNLRFLI